MTRRAKKRLFDVLRIALSIGALAIVIQGVTLSDHVVLRDGSVRVGQVTEDDTGQGWIDIQAADGSIQRLPQAEVAVDPDGALSISYGLRTAWRESAKMLLLLALGVHSLVVFPLALRLQLLLRAQSIHIGYWDALKLSFAGNFLNFAAPLGSNAGDVFKAYFVSLHTEHKTEAVATVALDRIVGLATLVAVVAAITVFSPAGARLAELRPYTLGVLVIGVVAVFAYRSRVVRRYLLPRTLLARLPMFDHLQRIDSAAKTLLDHKSIVVAAIALTLALQWLSLGAYFAVAVALALDAHAGNVVEYYAYFYAGALVQSLPGPPQGLGTVELVYRYLLAPFGSPSQIVCVAVAARVVVFMCALPGLLVTLTGSYKPRALASLRQDADADGCESTEKARGLTANQQAG
ncbi:MAG: lysylphosphatidylglycerol synthase transmembrane domain-containing protein [Phycisphaerae bacterium]